MEQGKLLPFGASGVATIRSSGVIDVRLIDDHANRTITSRMQVNELVDIASAVFENIEHDTSNPQKDRIVAREVREQLQAFKPSGSR